MTQTQRQIGLLTSMVVLMLIAALWSYNTLAHARHEAATAAQDLGQCHLLIDRIRTLRDRPNRAGAVELQLDAFASVVERAADQASLPRQQVVRIWPKARQRIGKTPYEQKATQLLVHDATLEQATRFLVELEALGQGMTTTAIRLSAPRKQSSQQQANHWTLDATVTYLIYNPSDSSVPRATPAEPTLSPEPGDAPARLTRKDSHP